jgi:hypothetical protein
LKMAKGGRNWRIPLALTAPRTRLSILAMDLARNRSEKIYVTINKTE